MTNEALSGGREGKIFRQENCIVRPANPWTKDVHAFLHYLIANGFTCVPHPMGFAEDGRERVSYVEGIVYNDSLPAEILTDEVLAGVAKLLRRYHDIGGGYMENLSGAEPWMLPARSPAEVLCHGDFAPYNMTFAEGKLYGVIDFDTLHPGPRLWDIAYAAYRWVPFVSETNPDHTFDTANQIRRLKVFADAYGMDPQQRKGLAEMMVRRVGALVEYMRGEAANGNPDVIRNIEEGHMDLYINDIAHFEANAETIAKVLAAEE